MVSGVEDRKCRRGEGLYFWALSSLLSFGTLGCASAINAKTLLTDGMHEGYPSVALVRVQVRDHTKGLASSGGFAPLWVDSDMGVADHRDRIERLAEPLSDRWQEQPDGGVVECLYVMEVRPGSYRLRGGPLAAGGWRTDVWLKPPITFSAKEGEVVHVGIVMIEVLPGQKLFTIDYGSELVHDKDVEQKDLAAFRTRYPKLAERLRAN